MRIGKSYLGREEMLHLRALFLGFLLKPSNDTNFARGSEGFELTIGGDLGTAAAKSPNSSSVVAGACICCVCPTVMFPNAVAMFCTFPTMVLFCGKVALFPNASKVEAIGAGAGVANGSGCDAFDATKAPKSSSAAGAGAAVV